MNLNEQIRKAAWLLKEGGIVALPTETVYGIAANALDAQAVAKIYAIKGRPAKNPLIVHVSDEDQMIEVVKEIPPEARKLIDHFWPGPLTLIFEKKPLVPDIVTGGLETVAVRMPSHPIALELIRIAEVPIAAPSANPSGKPSATHHTHVQKYFGKKLFVIEGGECPIGLESTVLNVYADPPQILRQGGLPQEEIEWILGKKVAGPTKTSTALSPGMMYRHYSPKARVVLVDDTPDMGENLKELIQKELGKNRKVGALVTREFLRYVEGEVSIVDLGSIDNLNGVAAVLFAALIELDNKDLDIIVVQSFPEQGVGKAIMDRLNRASKK